MPAVVPDTLKSAVIATLEAAATMDGEITPATTLASVGITGFVAESLAAPFERIAQGFRDDAVVGRSDCGSLNTVADAVALVAKAAGLA